MTSERPMPSDASAACPEPVGTSTAVEAAPLPAIDVDVFCPDCAYNLRSLTGIRCPECGTNIEAYRERGSVIPWVYRDKVGRIRAFWKTVWLVTFNDRQFGMELSRPVDERHARKFRWAVIAHAYLPVLAVTLLAFVAGILPRNTEAYVIAAMMQAAAIACLAAVTILPYWGFRHRDLALEMQHRAAVMMLYSPAPLAWTLLAGVLLMLGILCDVTQLGDAYFVFCMAGLALVVLSAALMLGAIRRIARHALGAGRPALWTSAKLIFACLVVAFFVLVVLPASVLFLGVVYYSLQ